MMHFALIYLYFLQVCRSKTREYFHVLIVLNYQMRAPLRFNLKSLVWSHLVSHSQIHVKDVHKLSQVIGEPYLGLSFFVIHDAST